VNRVFWDESNFTRFRNTAFFPGLAKIQFDLTRNDINIRIVVTVMMPPRGKSRFRLHHSYPGIWRLNKLFSLHSGSLGSFRAALARTKNLDFFVYHLITASYPEKHSCLLL
jgi:hypothetical protein